MSQQALCGRTQMDKVTVSRAAIALADRGLIERAANPDDQRSHLLTLSATGWALYEQVAPKALELEQRVFESFSAEEARYRLDLDYLLWQPLARIDQSGLVEDTDVFKEFEHLAEETSNAIKAFGELTWTYCHGDCHGFNARIDDAGEAVFFDFDDSGPGYLAYDLSVFLWANVSFGRSSTRRWTAFIETYRAVRPIKADDFEAALHFVIVRHFWLMGEYASRADEWGRNTVRWVAREAEFLKAWQASQLSGRLL